MKPSSLSGTTKRLYDQGNVMKVQSWLLAVLRSALVVECPSTGARLGLI